MKSKKRLIMRAEALLERIEAILPAGAAAPDWTSQAYRWRRLGERGWLQRVPVPHAVALDDLLHLATQKADIVRNTRRFLDGGPANNLLLWGSRGTGKSSLIKAVFHAFHSRGLRLIEVDKEDLTQLPDILDLLRGRPERFILFCDDLSFEAHESAYKALKAALDGSITATPDNVLIYATSNRRHLIPELQSENHEARLHEGELHQGEAVEEKISLSDRFGLWIAFHPFNQEQYLGLVHHWLARLDAGARPEDAPETRAAIDRAALRWSLRRGSRSGRTARQFALDWAGRA